MGRSVLITALSGAVIGACGCYRLVRRDWWRATGLLALGAAVSLSLIGEGTRSPGEKSLAFYATIGLVVISTVAVLAGERRRGRGRAVGPGH
jgi:hypothetical protein